MPKKDIHIVRRGDGWAVRREGAQDRVVRIPLNFPQSEKQTHER